MPTQERSGAMWAKARVGGEAMSVSLPRFPGGPEVQGHGTEFVPRELEEDLPRGGRVGAFSEVTWAFPQ